MQRKRHLACAARHTHPGRGKARTGGTVSTRSVRVVAVAAVAALGLAGCGGEETPKEDPLDSYTAPPRAESPSGSATPTRSPSSAPPESSRDAPSSSTSSAASNGGAPGPTESVSAPASEASAVAFVKRYFSTYNAAAKDPSTVAELDKLTLPGCKSCKGLRDEVAGWGRQDGRQNGDVSTIERATASFSVRQKLVLITIHQHAGTVKTSKGKVLERIKEKRFDREVLLEWNGGWKVAKIFTAGASG